MRARCKHLIALFLSTILLVMLVPQTFVASQRAMAQEAPAGIVSADAEEQAEEQDMALVSEASVASETLEASEASNVDKDVPAVPSEEGMAIAEDASASLSSEAAAPPNVTYHTHVQNVGWQDWRSNGAMAGTSGRALRLEGIEIKLGDLPCAGGISYRTHVQNVGWQDWVSDGAMSGTTGRALRLEAIEIRLTGELANSYDVYYRVHAQDYGWMGWAKNGARAGTAALAKRLEGIQIVVVPNTESAPATTFANVSQNTAQPYISRQVTYRTHVQNIGWQDWRSDGAKGGTSGRALRLEAINIKLCDALYAGGISYRTHVQNIGWQDWVSDGAMAGTSGRALRLEAIQVQLYGDMAEHYDVYYRVHAQNVGWMGWASNGAEAGTAGYALRLEAIQIVLVDKGAAAPAASFWGATQNCSEAFRQKGATPTATTGSSSTTGPATAGALRVEGSQLVDANGAPIELHGVSTHGLAWFPGYVNNDCFKQLRTQWNANVVRLAMYTEEYGGYCSGGNQGDLTGLVKNGVRYATDNDLYVIVDWHILSDGNPNTHVNEAKSFFQDISSTFRNSNNVIYEICNEPNGGTTWDQIVSYAKQVIPVIRQNDPDAVIIVGTPTWSQEVDKAAAQPLPYDNVMYALHFYAATHKDDLRNRMVQAVKGGLPVFVSEFGICDASGNGTIDESSANSWITTMKSLGVSWCMWSLCNKAESASAIKSSCNATSGFSASDLSTSGTWLLKALNGTLPAGTDNSQTSSTGSTGSSSLGSQATYTFTSGAFSCKAILTNSWDAGGGKRTYQYDLSITNNGSSCTSWTVAVPFKKGISLVTGWNGKFTVSGQRLTVKNETYNGSLAKGATISGIGFQVTADQGLAIDC